MLPKGIPQGGPLQWGRISFVCHQRSTIDRRSVRVSATDKGLEVARIVGDLYGRHIRSIKKIGGMTTNDLRQLTKALERLERFWTSHLLYRL